MTAGYTENTVKVYRSLNRSYKDRDTIIGITGLARSTVRDALTKLLFDGKIERHAPSNRGKGRKGRGRVFWRIAV